MDECSLSLAVGEGGYYLGVLEAAIQFVESWEEATYPPDLVQADIEHQVCCLSSMLVKHTTRYVVI